MRAFLSAGLSALAITSLAAPAWAEFPEREVRFIVPYAAGGNGDIVARLVAEGMSKHLGQPVVVENITGASGLVGTTQAALAPADGYTVVLSANVTVVNAIANPNVQFDIESDFDQVAGLTAGQLVLVTPPDRAWKTLEELLAHAKEHPGAVSYASTGENTSSHSAAHLFQREAGVELHHIPYSGAAQAQTDILAGRYDLYFTGVTNNAEFIANGDLRALGVTGPSASTALPGVASISDTVPGYSMTIWQGMMAPDGTPADAISRLNEAVVAALTEPAVVERLRGLDTSPLANTPAEEEARVAEEITTWTKLLKED